MESYLINQFAVQSAIPLPCPPTPPDAPRTKGRPIVTIERAPGPLRQFHRLNWAGRRLGGSYLRAYDVDRGLLICAGTEIRMLAETGGKRLLFDYDPADAAATHAAGIFASNLGLSLCSLMGGEIALHGAGVKIEDRYLGILARSGTGKSTLLWRLMDAGAMFGSDDVIPIAFQDDGVLAFPSVSLPAKLSRQAIEDRGLDWRMYTETYPGDDEYWIPVPEPLRVMEPCPLAALFVLQPATPSQTAGPMRVERPPDAIGISHLLQHTQGLWAAGGQIDSRTLMNRYAALIRRVPLYTITYRRQFSSIPDLIRLIRAVSLTAR
jgi:hypothetical protein